jgi:hypothetical protein
VVLAHWQAAQWQAARLLKGLDHDYRRRVTRSSPPPLNHYRNRTKVFVDKIFVIEVKVGPNILGFRFKPSQQFVNGQRQNCCRALTFRETSAMFKQIWPLLAGVYSTGSPDRMVYLQSNTTAMVRQFFQCHNSTACHQQL